MVTWMCRHIITYAHPDYSTPSSESKWGSHCYGTWLSPITGQNDDHFKSQKNGGNQRNPLSMLACWVFRCWQESIGITKCACFYHGLQSATQMGKSRGHVPTLVKVASFRVFPNTFSTSSCLPKPQMSEQLEPSSFSANWRRWRLEHLTNWEITRHEWNIKMSSKIKAAGKVEYEFFILNGWVLMISGL